MYSLCNSVNLLSPQNNSTHSLNMSKPLVTKVSTPLSENVQIGPKVSIFCVATIIFQHCLNPLGHWSPLPPLHDDISELVDVRDIAILHIPFEYAHRCSIGFKSGDMLGQSITFTLSFFSKAVDVIMLEYCPAAQSPKGGSYLGLIRPHDMVLSLLPCP